MDLLDKASDVLTDVGDKIGETVGGVIDGVKETADAVLHPIDTLLGNWGRDLLEGGLKLANKATFDIPNIKYVATVTNVFMFATTTFAICIVLYKVIEAQIQASNGSNEPLVASIIQRLFYSAIALAVLPWAMSFFIRKIVAPLGEYVISEIATDMNAEKFGENIRNFLVTTILNGQIGAIVLFIVLVFFAVSAGRYFISICVFYADFMVLTMLTPLVALSLLTDEQNYFNIWVKELLSQSLTMLMKMILFSIMVSLMFTEKSNFTTANFMVMLGCGALLIKTPSALQNMWYDTRRGGGGGGGKLATMFYLFKK